MSVLRISLFGKFSVEYDGKVLDGFEVGKVQELFSFLLIHRQEPHHREALANRLWRDSDNAGARRNLRKSLWQLQRALDAPFTSAKSEPILIVGQDWIRVNPASAYWLDVNKFEQAYALGHGVSGKKLSQTMVEALEAAVALYQGDLLLGWYQDWCLLERERLQRLYLIMLDKLMRHCQAHGRFESGLQYGAQILSYDGARERSHRCMMRLFYLSGDRTEALRQYERCATKLREELDVEPARRTQALYHQMRADQFAVSRPRDPDAPSSANTPFSSSLAELLEHLKQLNQELFANQQHVQKEIELIERMMNDKNR